MSTNAKAKIVGGADATLNTDLGDIDADLTTLEMLQNSLEVPKTLRYAIKSLVPTTATTTTTNDTYVVGMDDRTINTLTQGQSISYVELGFPDIVSGEVRDMLLILTCDANPPAIALGSFLSIYTEDPDTLVAEEGVNVYSFTEFESNKFIATRKLVEPSLTREVIDASELAIAAKVPTASTFNDIITALSSKGITANSTVQQAIDAALS